MLELSARRRAAAHARRHSANSRRSHHRAQRARRVLEWLGWRDRFSAPMFTSGQSDYQAKVFRTDAIYTPQVVVDGTLECIGSDRSAVHRAIERAAKAEKADVQLNLDDGTPQQ
jgi:hypothetical protein